MADNKKPKQKPVGEGRGMVGGTYRSGQYKGKTRNLTKKQVTAGRRVGKAGKATVGKKEATRAMKSVSIIDTTWRKASERTGPRAKGGILVGKDGKPITGTVTLASGAKATYVRGKRVAAAAKKPAGGNRGGGGGGGGGGRNTATGLSASNAERLRQVKNRERAMEGQRQTTRLPSGQQIAAAARQRRAARGRGNSAMYSQAGTRVSMSSTAPPKKGQTKTIINSQGFAETQRWDGSKWVFVSRSTKPVAR